MGDEERLGSIEKRLDDTEADLQKLRATVHAIKNEQQVLVGQMSDLTSSVDRVISFFEGTDKVFGFCRKHWRTMLKFGCGFVTAYGVTNPSVARSLQFVTHFFGL